LPELVTEIRGCFKAGATGAHFHPRDRNGAETLDLSVVNDACAHVRGVAEEISVPVEIGLTTGAWIEPNPAGRIAMIRE
jgi:uncharacterized protein (DUF849 family)